MWDIVVRQTENAQTDRGGSCLPDDRGRRGCVSLRAYDKGKLQLTENGDGALQLRNSKEQMMLASNLMAAAWVLLLIVFSGELLAAASLIAVKPQVAFFLLVQSTFPGAAPCFVAAPSLSLLVSLRQDSRSLLPFMLLSLLPSMLR